MVVFSSVELPRFGVRGGVGSNVGAALRGEVLGRASLSWCMSRNADGMPRIVKDKKASG